jgi:hypothetical protein
MIDVNVTATSFVVVSSSTQQNYTVSSDNTIFTVTNVTPNYTVTASGINITFQATGSNGIFGEIVANTATINNLIVNTGTFTNLFSSSGQIVRFTANTGTINNLISSTIIANTGTFTNLNATNAVLTNLISSNINASTGTFISLTTQNFNLNGLQYPSSRGAYGQVLSTNGSNYANWTNLGDLVYWSLSNDLYTNGFNIVSGSVDTPLIVGRGTTDNFRTSISFANSSTTISTPRGSLQIGKEAGSIYSGNKWQTENGYITLNSKYGILLESYNDQYTPGLIRLNSGIISLEGKVSGNFAGTDPVLIQSIEFPDGSILSTAYVGTGTNSIVPIASTTQTGVIKVGNNLTITGDGTLNANQNDYSLPAATPSIRGGVRIGNGITITNDDTINADYTTATIGIVSLTQDMYTNGNLIKWKSNGFGYINFPDRFGLTLGATDSAITFNPGYPGASIYLSAEGSSQPILIGGNGVDIRSGDILLKSTSKTVIGSDQSHSQLRVQQIYNYAGTYAPTFPAGVQFPDNSVQVTAWQTSTLYQQYIDFQNPQDPH